MQRSRGHCFTSFDVEHKPLFDESKMSYLVFQRESCPESKREHWQGYVHFLQPVPQKGVARLLQLSSCHAEPRRGSASQAADYCKKSDTFLGDRMEFGHIPMQGQRSDLVCFTDGIRAGKSIRELAFDQPQAFVRYHRGLMMFQQLQRAPFRDDIEVHYFHGASGIGKSRHVWTLLRPLYEKGHVYVAKDHTQGWFDGYCGESVVYFEDFRGNFPLDQMLQLIDRYPCSQWIKGASVPILATKFYFTSNMHPSMFYGGDEAWLRRLHHVIFFPLAEGGSGGESAAAPPAVDPTGPQM